MRLLIIRRFFISYLSYFRSLWRVSYIFDVAYLYFIFLVLGKKKELIEYYESQLGNMEEELKAEAAEILGKQWGEDVDDLNAEWKAFLVFHHELLGKEKIALPQR